MRGLTVGATVLCLLNGTADAAPFRESLSTLQQDDNQKASFFSRCSALAQNFWVGSAVWNGRETFQVLRVSPQRLFFKLSKNGFFAEQANWHTFEEGGSDWDAVWQEGKSSGNGLPFWAAALVMGVDELTIHNAKAYQSMRDSARTNEAIKIALLDDLIACERASQK